MNSFRVKKVSFTVLQKNKINVYKLQDLLIFKITIPQ